MRITSNSAFISYQRQLQDTQNRIYTEQTRINTGKKNINIIDQPNEIINIKELSSTIARNERNKSNIDDVVGELNIVGERLEKMEDILQTVRSLTIDGTQIGSQEHLANLGINIKGYLEDLVRNANADYNGKFLFSGTKTTVDSLEANPEAIHELPYELVEEDPTADNPSGLKVIFRGNNAERSINKAPIFDEVINVSGQEIFGSNVSEVFESVINIINIFSYDANGNPRGREDQFTKAELAKINEYQEITASITMDINIVASKMGAKSKRLEVISEQIQYENTQLRQIRSIDEDTDVVESSMNLSKNQYALQYSLQIGSKLLPRSLFDYLG